MIAATISDMLISRVPKMQRTMVDDRDIDGNIISRGQTGGNTFEIQTFETGVGGIPSFRYENLLKTIVIDSDQCLLVYHSLVQGNCD